MEVKKTHFLKPCKDSIFTPSSSKPQPLSLPSLPSTFEPQNWGLRVKFSGWRFPLQNWSIWVKKMQALHESTWKKAGIFEAIINSTYEIHRNTDLVFGVAERWFSETKSFIFSWGEASITLEDVLILGGFSVLGSHVSVSVESKESKEKERKLMNARAEFNRSPAKKARHSSWMQKFMDTDDLEHEAFLVCWLSCFVFPTGDYVQIRVFPIAVELARGNRVALAPAVLASIYRDLSILKKSIVAKTEPSVSLWSPLQLVQVWVWERFPRLQPLPNWLRNDEPRLARWNGLRSRVTNVRKEVEEASFEWRPYVKGLTNWKLPSFYPKREVLVPVDSSLDLDKSLSSFSRCVRISLLVGFENVELYLPHRVARQFGMDQDVPEFVPTPSVSPDIASSHYSKSSVRELYIPSSSFQGNATPRYLEWWEESLNRENGARRLKTVSKGRAFGSSSSSQIMKRKEKGVNAASDFSMARKMVLKRKMIGESGGPPLKISKNSAQVKEEYGGSGSEGRKRDINGTNVSPIDVDSESSADSIAQMELDNLLVPPGFPPKGKLVKAEPFVDQDEEDQLTIADILGSNKKSDENECQGPCNGGQQEIESAHHIGDNGKERDGKIDEILKVCFDIVDQVSKQIRARQSLEEQLSKQKRAIESLEDQVSKLKRADESLEDQVSKLKRADESLEDQVSKLKRAVESLKPAKFEQEGN